MWIGLREAAAENERPITGIMNPNSGPITDQGSLGVYLDTLKNVMGIGEGATYMLTQKKPTVKKNYQDGRVGGYMCSRCLHPSSSLSVGVILMIFQQGLRCTPTGTEVNQREKHAPLTPSGEDVKTRRNGTENAGSEQNWPLNLAKLTAAAAVPSAEPREVWFNTVGTYLQVKRNGGKKWRLQHRPLLAGRDDEFVVRATVLCNDSHDTGTT